MYRPIGVIKISFSFIFNKVIHALRGLLSQKGVSFRGPRGSAPWTPEVTSPPLTVYPGATPGGEHNNETSCIHVLGVKAACFQPM